MEHTVGPHMHIKQRFPGSVGSDFLETGNPTWN